MVARAGIRIDSETLAHDTLAILNGLAHQRTYAPLSIQLAFAVGHDDLRPPEFSTQCFAQQLERAAHVDLKAAIADCERLAEFVSRELFERILESEEEHIDWLETQLDLVQRVGLENYTQSQMEGAS